MLCIPDSAGSLQLQQGVVPDREPASPSSWCVCPLFWPDVSRPHHWVHYLKVREVWVNEDCSSVYRETEVKMLMINYG